MKLSHISRILRFYWKFFIRRIMKLPPEILVVSFTVIYLAVMFSFVGFLIRQDSEEKLPKGFVKVPGVSIKGKY